eukprot:TRINITY_DN6687_c0_g1_i1.p1 TRINITY_DN6687_c0_g1~~TRINITY_DN6687_c0_g1_i1.p1  ORF type:complete len:141 (+),score=33.44 TRINITY_DN6687_c0_g1_i1:33-455(+)
MIHTLFSFFFLRIRLPPRSTQGRSSAASEVYKRQDLYQPPLFSVVWSVLASPGEHHRMESPMSRCCPTRLRQNCFCGFSGSDLGVGHPLLASRERLEQGNLPGDKACLLYTSDAADDLLCVDIGGIRINKKKKKKKLISR